jgi:hypothetical protein
MVPGSKDIIYLEGTKTRTYAYPANTIAAWDAFIRAKTADGGKHIAALDSGSQRTVSSVFLSIVVGVLCSMALL